MSAIGELNKDLMFDEKFFTVV